MKDHAGWGSVYGLAFIGALVYYVQHASTFWGVVFALFKAIFWPAMIMYRVLQLLKM